MTSSAPPRLAPMNRDPPAALDRLTGCTLSQKHWPLLHNGLPLPHRPLIQSSRSGSSEASDHGRV
jgi:hypothetical protein